MFTEVSEKHAHEPPSAKQVKFLDGLAGKLGYQNGKTFARDLFGVNQYGVTKWDRDSVSTAINNAIARVDRQRKLARQRTQRGTILTR